MDHLGTSRTFSRRCAVGLGSSTFLFAIQATGGTCEDLAATALPHTTISSAVSVAATPTVPASFLVEAHSHPTSDSDIKILVGLPLAGWNGKYLQLGNGGFAGSVAPPDAAVQRGYAGAATDDGHSGSVFDASWALGHPEKVVDFGYRALKETTDVAKALISAFYSVNPQRSYFQGCSDGGREALQEAQRYPADFNGIVVGAPANFWTHHFTGFVYNQQVLTRTPIPASKLAAIQASALAQCDASDGVTDGVVSDPRRCHFNPGELRCKAGETDSCLTSAQISAVRMIMDGPRDPRTRRQIFPGYLFNAANDPANTLWMFDGSAFGLPAPAQFIFGDQFFQYMVFENPSWDFQTLNFTTDVDFADAKLASILNSTNPDLRPLTSKGAKVIMYHGWEDAAISPFNTIDYYRSAMTSKPGKKEDSIRLFMAPGMAHCGGGPGPNLFDALTALEAWVERGVPPDRIVATKYMNDDPTQGVVMTRPLCPYPQVANYTGTGSTNDERNFTCAAE